MGAVIVLVVVAGLVSAVSLAVARHGTRRPVADGSSPSAPADPRAPAPSAPPASAPPGRPPVPPAGTPRTRIPRRAGDAGRGPTSPRARKGARPIGRRDAVSGSRRRAAGPLSALSAVETRGRLARLDTVTFVEGLATAASAAPSLADTPGTPAPRSDQAVVAPEPAVAYDAEAEAARRLSASCQIVRVEQVGPGTLIDLVLLDACNVAGEAVPAGSPLALGFGPVPPGASCQDLEAVMGYWEAIGAVVDLEVAESAQATRYRFDCRDDGLALLVQSERP